MAVIPKEIKKNDKLIEWEKKAMSDTTDTTKSIFQNRKIVIVQVTLGKLMSKFII